MNYEINDSSARETTMTSEKEPLVRSYYTLKEAEGKLNCSEEDILYFGSTGRLPINILTNSLEVFSESIPIKSNGVNACETDLEDETEIIVHHDKENQVDAYNLRVSTKSIKKFAAHDLDARIVIEPLKYDDSTMIYFSLINSTYEVPKIKDCKLIILNNDIEAFLQLNTFTPNGITNLSPEANKLFSKDEVNSNKLTQSQKTNPYELRKSSADKWLNETKINIDALTKEKILDQLKQYYPNEKLWNIKFNTFKKDFWQKYSKDNNLRKKAGRPSKG